jgi:putative spermidine/putrescine transport system permease protein
LADITAVEPGIVRRGPVSRTNPPAARTRFRLPTSWLGVVPFFIFALMFLILPTLYLMVGAFQTPAGSFTLDNVATLFRIDSTRPECTAAGAGIGWFFHWLRHYAGCSSILSAYWISIKVSFASALIGALVGFGVAVAIVRGGLPNWIRSATLTFSGVASNFAGVPLAFAFLATLGRLGLVTVLLRELFGINIYSYGFNILSFWGLTLTYLFFQIPLMILIITPALDGLKREWREAALILGANSWQYWRYVAFPVLWPSLLGASLLLFANAFGAVATAYALTGSSLNIVTILLYAQIRGDVLHNANLGYALALGMILITGISNGAYIWLRGRSERWFK